MPQLIHTSKRNTTHKQPRNKQKTAKQLQKHGFYHPEESGLGAELLSGGRVLKRALRKCIVVSDPFSVQRMETVSLLSLQL